MSNAVSTAFPLHSGNAGGSTTLVILDTQVVMDWLVFDEPSLLPLISAVVSRRLHWTATSAMKAELLHVIGRGVAARYAPDVVRIHEAFERHCRLVDEPVLGIARPRCSDTDDQKFIDLGLALASTQSTTLISRDRAVLKVAKRAAKFGLPILSPTAWLKLNAATPTV
jgi:predicted nucleic acid-binding protein